jgi:hypothetical protein
MSLHKITVELSDEEIAILEELSKRDGSSPNDVLRKAIAQAGYVFKQTSSGQKFYVGQVQGDRIMGNQVNIGDATVTRND